MEKCNITECLLNKNGECACSSRQAGRCFKQIDTEQEEIVKINWSGGKDSTAAALMRIKDGYKCKIICYVPMLTEKIPMLLKCHYNFILEMADRFRSMGAEVYIVSGMTYYEYVTRRAKCGKRKGQILGFPAPLRGMCGFKRDSKLKALNSVDVGYYDFEEIGIAYDEKDRQSILSEKIRSTLVENKMCEIDATLYCEANNALSPNYNVLKRDGCSLCANAPQKERDMYFNDWPEAVPVVLELQQIVKKECPERAPLRGKRWFIEED